MTPAGDAYRAELLRAECPEDGGESPFGWVDGCATGSVTPSEGQCGHHGASGGVGGGIPLPVDSRAAEGRSRASDRRGGAA